MTTTYTITSDGCTVTFGDPLHVRVPAASTCFDATYLVPAGTYPLKPITIEGRDAAAEDAYCFRAELPGTLKRGGYPDQVVGVTTRIVAFVPDGDAVRARVAKMQAAE